jgi:hypothetical protein
VQVQPGQSLASRPEASVASRRATGGWKHTQRGSRPRGFSSDTVYHRDADAVSASARQHPSNRHLRGCLGVAGVPSPGHAFKGNPREPRRALYLPSNWVRFRPTRREPGPEENEGVPREANRPSTRGTCRQGRPESAGKGRERSYEPIVPMKVANRRAPGRGGHGNHWREGGNR